jgi:SAM-dependent methyltransferase
MLDPNQSYCPLCGAPTATTCRQHEGYIAGSSFAILCCSGCGTAHASPLKANSAVYDFIYNHSAQLPGYSRYHQYAAQIKTSPDPLQFLANAEENYFGVRAALLGKLRLQGSRILEIGSGLGYTTYSLARAGADVCGIDMSQVAVERATETFGPLYRCASLAELAATEHGQYDAIVAMEVLEHVEDPLGFVDEMRPLLKKGGIIVLSTPRKYRQFPTIWDSDLPPVHLWWFTEEGLKAIASKLGLECSLVDTSDHSANRINPYAPPDVHFRKRSLVSEDYKLISPTLQRVIRRKARTLLSILRARIDPPTKVVLTRALVATFSTRAG